MAGRRGADIYQPRVQSPRSPSPPPRRDVTGEDLEERRARVRRDAQSGWRPLGNRKRLEQKAKPGEVVEAEQPTKKQKNRPEKQEERDDGEKPESTTRKIMKKTESAMTKTDSATKKIKSATKKASSAPKTNTVIAIQTANNGHTARLLADKGFYRRVTHLNKTGRSAVSYYNSLAELLQQIAGDAPQPRPISEVYDFLEARLKQLKSIIRGNGQIQRGKIPITDQGAAHATTVERETTKEATEKKAISAAAATAGSSKRKMADREEDDSKGEHSPKKQCASE